MPYPHVTQFETLDRRGRAEAALTATRATKRVATARRLRARRRTATPVAARVRSTTAPL